MMSFVWKYGNIFEIGILLHAHSFAEDDILKADIMIRVSLKFFMIKFFLTQMFISSQIYFKIIKKSHYIQSRGVSYGTCAKWIFYIVNRTYFFI